VRLPNLERSQNTLESAQEEPAIKRNGSKFGDAQSQVGELRNRCCESDSQLARSGYVEKEADAKAEWLYPRLLGLIIVAQWPESLN
jgi:hypothetical protein